MAETRAARRLSVLSRVRRCRGSGPLASPRLACRSRSGRLAHQPASTLSVVKREGRRLTSTHSTLQPVTCSTMLCDMQYLFGSGIVKKLIRTTHPHATVVRPATRRPRRQCRAMRAAAAAGVPSLLFLCPLRCRRGTPSSSNNSRPSALNQFLFRGSPVVTGGQLTLVRTTADTTRAVFYVLFFSTQEKEP